MMLQVLNKTCGQFWFKSSSPSSVCLYRIAYGILCTIYGVTWIPSFAICYGQHAILSAKTAMQWNPYAASLLIWLNPNEPLLMSFLFLYIVAACCLTIGLYSNVSAAVVFILLVSFQNRNPFVAELGEQLLRMAGFLMIFAPISKLYSIDSWLQSHHTNKSAVQKTSDTLLVKPWAQRLLQIQMASIYWQTFWCKIPNVDWRNGTAIYYITHSEQFAQCSVPYLFNHMWTCQLLSWGTLMIELSLWSLVWIKGCRYWVLLFGTIFHLIIAWSLNVLLLQFVMIAYYINFIEPSHVDYVANRLKSWWHHDCRSKTSIHA